MFDASSLRLEKIQEKLSIEPAWFTPSDADFARSTFVFTKM